MASIIGICDIENSIDTIFHKNKGVTCYFPIHFGRLIAVSIVPRSGMRYLLFVLMISMSFNLLAEPVPMIGGGTISCGKWISAVEDEHEMQMQISIQWVAGYIGSYNWYRAQGGQSITSQPDLETISLWVTLYCRNNPTDTVFSASAALVQHLGGKSTPFRWAK